MMKGSSANRMTKIKVFEGGKCIKTITNASINYGQDFDQLRKMIEIAIRLSPQDPIYNVEKVFVASEGKDNELDQDGLEQFQNVLFRPESQLVAQKVALTVSVLHWSSINFSFVYSNDFTFIDSCGWKEGKDPWQGF